LVTRYRDDYKLFPDMWHKVGLALAIPFLAIYPFHFSDLWINVANDAMIFVVGSVSLMILTGFCGQISLGHAAFLAIGAFTTAKLGHMWGVPFWMLMPLAGLISAAVGVAIGVFALRLKGLYLAIVTLGLLYIVEHTLMHIPSISGGESGTAVPAYAWFGEGAYQLGEAVVLQGLALPAHIPDMYLSMDYGPITLLFNQKLYFIFLIVAVLVAWMGSNLARSNAGRAMMAVRDHDIAATALGVNPTRAKLTAFGVSSFFAGIAGAMLALKSQTLSVEDFNLFMCIDYIAMIVLGGIGTIFGAVAGGIFFAVFRELSKDVGSWLPYIEKLPSAQQSAVLFSLLVCVFLIVEPLGLFGIWMRIKRYFMAWPFRY
jgi:branched-chain amino acid transport system permease protein